ncbi:MAG: electron transfer flavoprotein subunit beta/FixA family protein [Thermoplasmata archaeon]|nr:electron transfer flavoprotein subunit beta/FixA family protein [Thermoplasmata archaeon]
MEIVVAVKPVPEAETRLRPDASHASLDPEGVKFVLAGYDESAVEQALLLKESTVGSRVRVLSFGPAPRTEEVLRAAVALGCDSATWVEHPSDLLPDAVLSARCIATAIAGPFSGLVLCGRQSGDEEGGIFAGALGALLKVPSLGYATNLRWKEPRGQLTLQRSIEGGLEEVESSLPLVVGLQQAWNDPRTAKLPNILKSRKAAIEKIPWEATVATLGPHAIPGTVRRTFRLPPPRTGAKMIRYDSPQDAAAQLVRLLREEAKVFP